MEKSIVRLISAVNEYVKDKTVDVARGVQSPKLAAQLLYQYGLGVGSAASLLFGPGSGEQIMAVVKQAAEKFDPHWEEHLQQLWAEPLSDLVLRREGKPKLTLVGKDE